MTPSLQAQYSAGTMAPENAKKYAREIEEIPNGLSKYMSPKRYSRDLVLRFKEASNLVLPRDGCVVKALGT